MGREEAVRPADVCAYCAQHVDMDAMKARIMYSSGEICHVPLQPCSCRVLGLGGDEKSNTALPWCLAHTLVSWKASWLIHAL